MHFALYAHFSFTHQIALMSFFTHFIHNNVSDKQKVQYFLNGAVSLTAENNIKLFLAVQKFIIDSKRFTK